MASLFDLLPVALQLGNTVLSAGSQVAKGNATAAIGARRKALADFEALQLEQSGQESRSVGMQNAVNEGIKAKLVQSEALARAAASGAGASDPTVMSIIARTAGEGSYRQALAMYEGEAQGRLDRMRAAGLRYQGQNFASDASMAQGQSTFGAITALLTGGLKTAGIYEHFNPKAKTAPAAQAPGPQTALSGASTMYEKYWSGPTGGTLDTGSQLPEDIG